MAPGAGGGRLVRRAADAIAAARAKAPERWASNTSLERRTCGAESPRWSGLLRPGSDHLCRSGISLPRDSSQQAECGTAVPSMPGARVICCFPGDVGRRITHVAFAGEADTLVHSSIANGRRWSSPGFQEPAPRRCASGWWR